LENTALRGGSTTRSTGGSRRTSRGSTVIARKEIATEIRCPKVVTSKEDGHSGTDSQYGGKESLSIHMIQMIHLAFYFSRDGMVSRRKFFLLFPRWHGCLEGYPQSESTGHAPVIVEILDCRHFDSNIAARRRAARAPRTFSHF